MENSEIRIPKLEGNPNDEGIPKPEGRPKEARTPIIKIKRCGKRRPRNTRNTRKAGRNIEAKRSKTGMAGGENRIPKATAPSMATTRTANTFHVSRFTHHAINSINPVNLVNPP